MADEYKVKIVSEGDSSGAEKVEKAVKKVGEEAQKTADKATEAGTETSSAFSAAKPAIEAVASTAKKTGEEVKAGGEKAKVAASGTRGAFGGLPAVFAAVATSATAMWAAITAGLSLVIGALAGAFKTIGTAATFQDLEASFTTLLGSVDAAKERMADLAKFAAQTPFELGEVAQASRVLQNFTDGALATGDGLRLIGDLAAATGQPFGEVAVTVGRFYSALKSGTPAGEAAARLRELTGDNYSQIKSWDEAREAMSKYSGEMDRRSKTWNGMWSSLMDGVAGVAREIGKPLIDMLIPAVDLTTQALGWLSGRIPPLIGFIKELAAPIVAVLTPAFNLAIGSLKLLGNAITAVTDALDAGQKFRESASAADEISSATEKATASTKKLASAQEDAADAAKRLKAEIDTLTEPLDEMSKAADRARERIDALADAKKRAELSRIDLQEAEGTLTPKEASLRRNAVNASYAFDENARAQKDAEAELARAKEAADSQRKKTDLAMMVSVFGKGDKGERSKAFNEAAKIQAELDARVADAQSKLEGLQVDRGTIENARDAANLKAHSTEDKKDAKTDQKLGDKREELKLEAALAEAKARGATAEERRLNWYKDYQAVIESTKTAEDPTGDEALAQRIANARNPVAPAAAKIQVSNLAARGGAMGESIAAARGNTQESLLKQQVKNTEDATKLLSQMKTLLENPPTSYVKLKGGF